MRISDFVYLNQPLLSKGVADKREVQPKRKAPGHEIRNPHSEIRNRIFFFWPNEQERRIKDN